LELLNASSEEALNLFVQVEKRNIQKLGNTLPTVVFPTHPTPVKNIRTDVVPAFSDSKQVII
jgi:hypothetical protein